MSLLRLLGLRTYRPPKQAAGVLSTEESVPRYEVTGSFNGISIKPAIIEANDLKHALEKARAKGVRVRSVSCLDQPASVPPPLVDGPPGGRGSTVAQQYQLLDAKFQAIVVALALLIFGAIFFLPALTKKPPKMDGGPSTVEELNAIAGKVQDDLDVVGPAKEGPEPPPRPARRRFDTPGSVAALKGKFGGRLPLIEPLHLDRFRELSDAKDNLSLAGMMIDKEWRELEPGTRVRVLSTNPWNGWSEVRVESGPEVGRAGMVLTHTLADPEEFAKEEAAERDRKFVQEARAAAKREERELEERTGKLAEWSKRTAKERAEQEAKRIRTLLRQAEGMLKNGQPGVAKDYARKVLELAPEGSPERARAQEIIKMK